MYIDLDANASYQPSADLLEALGSAWSKIGNPSSLHRRGQRAKAAIEEARQSIRDLLDAKSSDTVIFTSGASEANNTVINSAAKNGLGLVSSTIEHPCILRPLERLAAAEYPVTLVSPSSFGEIIPEQLAQALNKDIGLVSIMYANNETGVINDIASIVALVRELAPNAIIHTDAAQAIGKVPVSFTESGVDLMTISGHKVGALPGVGALIARKGVAIEPLILGGAQEHKLRGGTENVLGVISFGAVAKQIRGRIPDRSETMKRTRDLFESAMLKQLPEIRFNGKEVARLPNTSSVWLPGVRAEDILVALDNEGVLVSSGAACSSGKPEPSHVLLAMGQPDSRARQTIRVSFHVEQGSDVALIAAEKIARINRRITGLGGGAC